MLFNHADNSIYRISVLCFICSVLALEPVYSAESINLEEIKVTARKREESLQDSPVAVTAISSADIQAASLQDIADIDRVTPNLWFQGGSRSAGTSNNAQVFIRGIGQFDFIPTADPGVGSYVDGVFLGRAVGGIFNLVDIERIEVLRGPQGTLFGRNTIGGAINVISSKPDFEKTRGFLEFKAGNDSWLEGSGVANLPLGDTLAARVSFNIKDRDGFGTSTVAPDIDWGNNENYSIKGSVRWQASETFELIASADYYHQNQFSMPSNASFFTGAGLPALNVGAVLFGILPGPPEFLPGGPPGSGAPVIPTPGTVFPQDSLTSSKSGPSRDDGETWGVSMTMQWDAFDWGTIKSVTSYRDMDLSFADDNDAYFIDLAVTDDDFDQWQVSQELQLIGQLGNLNWINGFYYFHERATELNQFLLMPGFVQALEAAPAAIFPVTPTSVCPGAFPANVCAGGAGNPVNLVLDNNSVEFNDMVVDNIAIYTQGSYQLTEQWSLTAGFRFTYEEKEFTRSQFKPDSSAVLGFPFFSVPLATLRDSWSNFSPKAGVEYKVNDDTLVYASFTKGFRSGTFNGRGGAPEAVSESVEPEEVTSYELGLKTEFFDNRARANFAFYFNDYDDLHIQQVLVTSTGGFSVFLLNAASAKTWGGEAELTLVPHANWELSGSLGYTHAEIKEISAADSAASGINAGDKLRKTPEWTFHLAASYTHPLSYGDLNLRLAYAWRDELFHNADNNPLSLEDSLGLLDARATFRSTDGKWEISAFGTNLTDEVYYNDIFVPGGAEQVNYWARGREYGVSLRYYFN